MLREVVICRTVGGGDELRRVVCYMRIWWREERGLILLLFADGCTGKNRQGLELIKFG